MSGSTYIFCKYSRTIFIIRKRYEKIRTKKWIRLIYYIKIQKSRKKNRNARNLAGNIKDVNVQNGLIKEYLERQFLLDDETLNKVIEITDNTNLSGEVACGAGGCEVVSA